MWVSRESQGKPLNPTSTDVYAQMDLPLVPVLLRDMSARLAVTVDTLAGRIYADARGLDRGANIIF